MWEITHTLRFCDAEGRYEVDIRHESHLTDYNRKIYQSTLYIRTNWAPVGPGMKDLPVSLASPHGRRRLVFSHPLSLWLSGSVCVCVCVSRARLPLGLRSGPTRASICTL